MSTALFIVAKKKIKGFDPFVNGKAIGKVDDAALDSLCSKLGVTSLFSFISQDPNELEEFLGEEALGSDGEGELPTEEWFDAQDGLSSVNALIAHLKSNPSVLPDSGAILEDLHEYLQVLTKLAEKKVKWHLAFDF